MSFPYRRRGVFPAAEHSNIVSPCVTVTLTGLPSKVKRKEYLFHIFGIFGARRNFSPSVRTPPNPYTIFIHAAAIDVVCSPCEALRL